ncbi:MAG: integrase arm-type DNA-binding domain-containing protein, partial [Deltaproteobacteria bacterium]|nr:integrase arm-type DNA-binding domain-containing protein [Deltaproteobacteria bacterium]
MSKLTAVQVRNAKTTGKAYKLADGFGLHLYVSKTGRKTWRYRFRIAGVESVCVIGEYPQMNLTDARSARNNARDLVKVGKNPAHARKDEIKARLIDELVKKETFETVALEWVAKQIDSWSASHSNAVMKSLTANVFPEIGNIPIGDITSPDLVKMMEKIEKRGALEMARKVLQRINSVFMYANRQGKLSDNPAANLKGSLKTRKVVHRPALSKDELPQFFKDLEKARMHISTKFGLRFLILTAARTDEVRRSVWSEID